MSKAIKFIQPLIFILLLVSYILGAESFYIAPSIEYKKVTSDGLVYHITSINQFDSLLDIETVVTNTKLSDVLKEKNYDIIINANFFDPNSKEPVGLVVKNYELLHLPIKRGVFGITSDNKAIIDIFNINIKLKIDNTIIPINNLNSPRGADQITIFTKFFGKETKILDNAVAGVDIEVSLDDKIPSLGTTSGKISNIYYGVKKSIIKDNSCIISLGGTALKYLPFFSLNKKIEIIVESNPPIRLKEAVCGGPILIKNGEIVLDKTGEIPFNSNIINSRHPRTVVGITDDKIFFIVIEGRNNNSSGLSIPETCELVKNMGIRDAINLDGGGSSQKIIWGNLINQVSERSVPVGIGVKNNYPYKNPTYLSFKEKDDIYIRKGEKLKLELLLQDENYHPYSITYTMLTWTIANDNINFNPSILEVEGRELGESSLTIYLSNLEASKKIYVWDYVALKIEIDEDKVYLGDSILPKIYAIDNLQREKILSLDGLKFDPNYFRRNGKGLTAINPGITTITYTFNNLSATYTIEIVPNTIEDFEEDKKWNIRGKNYNPDSTFYKLTSDAYTGKSSFMLVYDSKEENSFIYVDLNISIPPDKISLSIALKGQGNGWIRLLFYDDDGTPWVMDLTTTLQYNFNKWTTINKDLTEIRPLISINKNTPKIPIRLASIYLVGLNNKISGNLLIDSLNFK
uniref:Phosphodiester glycosidase family protein n=1 Tax=Dictyoglomus thermophilum TaxID=14 RepID=A0A7C3MJ31_DICTH